MIKCLYFIALFVLAIHAADKEKIYTSADSDEMRVDEILDSKRRDDGAVRVEVTLDHNLRRPGRTATVLCFYPSGPNYTVRTGDFVYGYRFYCTLEECTSNQHVGVSGVESTAIVS